MTVEQETYTPSNRPPANHPSDLADKPATPGEKPVKLEEKPEKPEEQPCPSRTAAW